MQHPTRSLIKLNYARREAPRIVFRQTKERSQLQTSGWFYFLKRGMCQKTLQSCLGDSIELETCGFH